ncbi:hypothetical protein niasHT_009529 [Heterodera trifolii]|uniref:Uridine 5'-monophosphate synthase n=1 Tax=Heterodera trifolii TaxID=157864 RepID=A0ABD2LQ08_9BILA
MGTEHDDGEEKGVQQLLEQFVAEGAVQLGQFTLKSGQLSPIYVDLRVLVSVPKIMKEAARCLCSAIELAQLDFDYVVGVPFGAIMLATLVSASLDKPMLLKRKEAKTYGKKQLIEGRFEAGQSALIIEDVVTSGASVLETVAALRAVGLRCVHVFCVLDRQQGGEQRLAREADIVLRSLLSMGSLLDFLEQCGTIDADKKAQIVHQLQNPTFDDSVMNLQGQKTEKEDAECVPLVSSSSVVPSTTSVGWAQQFADGTLNRRLAQIMVAKRTNVCLAVDCTHCDQILEIVSAVKDHVCAVKLHHDIVVDFGAEFVAKLHQLADAHQFLIVEDRKFADTGKTMEMQLAGGRLPVVADWADLVTAHALSGMASILALKSIVACPSRRLSGLLLIAQLSTDGALTDGAYAAKCARIGRECGDKLVAGFICQQRCSGESNDGTEQQQKHQQFLHWTPGVNLSGASGDGLGQRWRTPAEAVARDACDIVVVGRGITGAADIGAEAQRYARVAWDALRAARAWTD